jgi:hypothetical protein
MCSAVAVFADTMVGDASLVGYNGGTTFTDMTSSHWAYNTVDKMVGYGLVKGYPDGSFKPSGMVTYGEFLKMVATAYSSFELRGSNMKHWAFPYYYWLYSKGIVDSSVILENQLSDPITRDVMAYVLARTSSETLSTERINYVKNNLSDINSSNLSNYIIKAYALGFLTGYPDGTFKPKGTLTRAEAATAVARIAHIIKAKSVDIPTEDNTPGSGEESYNPWAGFELPTDENGAFIVESW